MLGQEQKLLEKLFYEAVNAADPDTIVRQHIPQKPKGRTVVIGVGKAAANLAVAFEAHFSGPLSGVVVTPYGHGKKCKCIEVLEAAHPIPDLNGLKASRAILSAVKNLTASDLVVAFVCGGGSALLPSPPGDLPATAPACRPPPSPSASRQRAARPPPC